MSHQTRRIVTLPPAATQAAALELAQGARARGADLLELRTDLSADPALDVRPLAQAIPLLVSQRGKPIPPTWEASASLVDVDVTERALVPAPRGLPKEKLLLSHHAREPLAPKQAEALWRAFLPLECAHVKHVEPLGHPKDAPRLFETRERLRAIVPPHVGVTVLGMGAWALPFRCVLAADNALDYLALTSVWSAAPGQRLLADAMREFTEDDLRQRMTARLGIFGSRIQGSRSPRIHPQPFDRLDLPEDARVELLLAALMPHYRGFAVTSPFKKSVAAAVGANIDAVNTLYRQNGRYHWANTDIAGAKTALQSLLGLPRPKHGGSERPARAADLAGTARARVAAATGEGGEGGAAAKGNASATGAPSATTVASSSSGERAIPTASAFSSGSVPRSITVLGDGGATFAVRQAATELGLDVTVRTRETLGTQPISGPVVWTWPDNVSPPPALSFREARVAVIAYGAAAKRLADEIRRRGGTPVRLGARWFVAQAREQRRLWETAT